MADESVLAPATHRQPSRKGRKAWRKNVDLTDVQDGLETVRDQIVAGGVIAEKPDAELFVTDVSGDADIKKKLSSKKLLRADEILAERSAIPALDGKKRKAPEVSVPSSKKLKNGTYVSHRELQRLRRVADMADGRLLVEEPPAVHDPWATTEVQKDPRLNFLDDAKATREPRTLKEAPHPLTTTGKALPNVPKPVAGKSYNPLVGDWSALLAREGAAAVAEEQARLAREAAAEEAQLRAEAEAAKVDAAEKDEYATDYDSAWESEWDGIQSGAEDNGVIHTVKQPRRKTVAERNKIKARKERETKEKAAKKEKLRDEQARRIKQIAKEMSANDKARHAKTKSLVLTRNESGNSSVDEDDVTGVELKRRRFGALPIPEAPLEVVLPEELEDSLRRLKPEGNLLTERYRNLLVGGKIEARKRVWQRKQGRKERTEKWSYKDWKLK